MTIDAATSDMKPYIVDPLVAWARSRETIIRTTTEGRSHGNDIPDRSLAEICSFKNTVR